MCVLSLEEVCRRETDFFLCAKAGASLKKVSGSVLWATFFWFKIFSASLIVYAERLGRQIEMKLIKF